MAIYYTDGSCKPSNPGPGGFGVIGIGNNDIFYTYYKHFEHTTNNRMELEAILHVMKHFSTNPYSGWNSTPPIVYSDSAYAVNAFNDWMFSWSENDWCKSNNQPIENYDLIIQYWNMYKQGYRIDLRKIKGHAGHKWNELVDQLASLPNEEAYEQWKKELYNE